MQQRVDVVPATPRARRASGERQSTRAPPKLTAAGGAGADRARRAPRSHALLSVEGGSLRPRGLHPERVSDGVWSALRCEVSPACGMGAARAALRPPCRTCSGLMESLSRSGAPVCPQRWRAAPCAPRQRMQAAASVRVHHAAARTRASGRRPAAVMRPEPQRAARAAKPLHAACSGRFLDGPQRRRAQRRRRRLPRTCRAATLPCFSVARVPCGRRRPEARLRPLGRCWRWLWSSLAILLRFQSGKSRELGDAAVLASPWRFQNEQPQKGGKGEVCPAAPANTHASQKLSALRWLRSSSGARRPRRPQPAPAAARCVRGVPHASSSTDARAHATSRATQAAARRVRRRAARAAA